jgi:hypothetical protein
MERIDELPSPKLCVGEGWRSPAPGARRTRRPRQRRGDVDRAAHLPMGRDLDRVARARMAVELVNDGPVTIVLEV